MVRFESLPRPLLLSLDYSEEGEKERELQMMNPERDRSNECTADKLESMQRTRGQIMQTVSENKSAVDLDSAVFVNSMGEADKKEGRKDQLSQSSIGFA